MKPSQLTVGMTVASIISDDIVKEMLQTEPGDYDLPGDSGLPRMNIGKVNAVSTKTSASGATRIVELLLTGIIYVNIDREIICTKAFKKLTLTFDETVADADSDYLLQYTEDELPNIRVTYAQVISSAVKSIIQKLDTELQHSSMVAKEIVS